MSNVIDLTARPRRATRTHQPETPAVPTATESAPERAVYTVTEAAYLLSLSLGSTYTLVRSGQIPARKIGGRWVIPKQRFHSWLNALPTDTDFDSDKEDSH